MTTEVEYIENFLFFSSGTTCYISSNYIDDITDNEIRLLSTKEIHNIEKKLVYFIYCDANIIGYMDKEQNFNDIGSKKVIIPKLKTNRNLTITIVNAEIIDDSEVNDEIKLGTDQNALTLVAQNLWLEINDSINNFYTIINYCISNSNDISSKNVYMDQKYKYSITKNKVYITHLKYGDSKKNCIDWNFYIPYIYIAENLETVCLLKLNYFYESTIPDIKSPFYTDSMVYINGSYCNSKIYLFSDNKVYLYGNNIYFTYSNEHRLTTPLSCINKSLNIESIFNWKGYDMNRDFKIHNLKKLVITDLSIPIDYKLRNLDGDIEITRDFTMGSNSEIQCKKLTF